MGDLITDNNLFLHEDPYVTITPEQRFFVMGVVHSLPSDWKTVIKGTLSRCRARANLTGFFHRKTIELSLCRVMQTRQSDS